MINDINEGNSMLTDKQKKEASEALNESKLKDKPTDPNEMSFEDMDKIILDSNNSTLSR